MDELLHHDHALHSSGPVTDIQTNFHPRPDNEDWQALLSSYADVHLGGLNMQIDQFDDGTPAASLDHIAIEHSVDVLGDLGIPLFCLSTTFPDGKALHARPMQYVYTPGVSIGLAQTFPVAVADLN
jgi:hypothetical protein